MNTIQLPRLLRCLQPIDFPHKLGALDRVFGNRLSARGIVWVTTSNGQAWKLDLSNPTHRWIVYGKYEGSPFLNWAKKFLPLDGIVIDSGANIGQMLLYLSLWVTNGRILAFEPGLLQSEWLAECLVANIQLPVELIRMGLGASPANLCLKDVGPGNVHGAWSQITEDEGEPIQVVRLEDELAARSIDRVDLWKLDVEGYEVPALQGAETLLRAGRIRAVYVELAGMNASRVREYLASFGYECNLFNRNGNLYRPGQLASDVHTNGLFLPR